MKKTKQKRKIKKRFKNKLAVVVLAAGLGTRFKSELPKVMHSLCGKPMVYYSIAASLALKPDIVCVVVGYGRTLVSSFITQEFEKASDKIYFAVQKNQLGTADAVRAALGALEGFNGDIMILSGDTPLITSETLGALLEAHRKFAPPLSFVSVELGDPSGYGRVVRDINTDDVTAVVEEKDASRKTKEIREVNAGIYVVNAGFLRDNLSNIVNDNAAREFYLTDLIELSHKSGSPARCFIVDDDVEVMGINDRSQLATARELLQEYINHQYMLNGVTLVDPRSAYIDTEAKISKDVIIMPNVHIRGETKIGRECIIGTGCVIENSIISQGSKIKPYSHIESSLIGEECEVGPFAHLRPETRLSKKVKIGNFVETKKTFIAEGSKANHLSYLGDATIGKNVNVGAGTITCNYDGKNKNQTIIEDGVFIGSDTQLVAPVTVGKDAYVASGTTVTEDVPDGALAISRVRQENKHDWVAKKKIHK